MTQNPLGLNHWSPFLLPLPRVRISVLCHYTGPLRWTTAKASQLLSLPPPLLWQPWRSYTMHGRPSLNLSSGLLFHIRWGPKSSACLQGSCPSQHGVLCPCLLPSLFPKHAVMLGARSLSTSSSLCLGCSPQLPSASCPTHLPSKFLPVPHTLASMSSSLGSVTSSPGPIRVSL